MVLGWRVQSYGFLFLTCNRIRCYTKLRQPGVIAGTNWNAMLTAPTAIRKATNRRNLAGHRSGMLVAVREGGLDRDGHVLWECRCDCGATKLVPTNSLARGKGATRSCGCLRRAVSSRPKVTWNKGKTYATTTVNGAERVFRQKHAWAKAVIRAKGNACEICRWDKARCDVHHRVPKGRGGHHTVSNGVVVCPNCHRMIHEGVVPCP